MNYRNDDITDRAKESPLWNDLSHQEGRVLPYMLERYLLLENWSRETGTDGLNYLHILLAEACTALLGQEERLRALEASRPPTAAMLANKIADALSDAGFLPGSIDNKRAAANHIRAVLNVEMKKEAHP